MLTVEGLPMPWLSLWREKLRWERVKSLRAKCVGSCGLFGSHELIRLLMTVADKGGNPVNPEVISQRYLEFGRGQRLGCSPNRD